MQMNYRRPRTTLALVCGFGLSAPAGAAYFGRADANAIQSLGAGLGVPSVAVLQRQPRNT
jgi:hypothetical protein